MPIPFPNFDAHLPADIRSRGENYFMSGAVSNLAQDGADWAADVSGTEEYTVELTLRKNEITAWGCDCPYDWGPVCKHMAAAFFAVKKELAERPLRVQILEERFSAECTQGASRENLLNCFQYLMKMRRIGAGHKAQKLADE